MAGARPTKPQSMRHSKQEFWEFVERCWDPVPDSRPKAHNIISSLPLERPTIDTKHLEALPHLTWVTHTRSTGESGLRTPSYQCHDTIANPCVDPCIVGLIAVDKDNEKSVLKLMAHLYQLRCPEDIARFVWDQWSSTMLDNSCSRTQGANGAVTARADDSIDSFDDPDRTHWFEGLEPKTMVSLLRLVLRNITRQQYKQACRFLQHLVYICRNLAQSYPAHFRPLLSEALHNLGHSLHQLGRWVESIECMEEAIELRRVLELDQPGEFRESLALSLHNIAADCHALGDHGGAANYLQRAVCLRRILASEDPERFNPLSTLR